MQTEFSVSYDLIFKYLLHEICISIRKGVGVGPDGSHCRSGLVRLISPLTGIPSPDRPARSESQYRLSYPGLRILLG